jgi:hypothetical protein
MRWRLWLLLFGKLLVMELGRVRSSARRSTTGSAKIGD